MRGWQLAGGRAWLTPWRALVAVSVLVGCTGLVGLLMLQREVHARALNSARFSAQLIDELVVGRNITTDILRTGVLDADRRADMDADVTKLRENDHINGLAVWSLRNGRLVYADGGHSDVPGTLPAREMARSRLGQAFTVTTGGSLNVFLPIDADPRDGPGIDAVVEVMLPNDSINSSIAANLRLINSGAAVLALAAVVLLWRARRRMLARERALRQDSLTKLGNRAQLTHRAHEVLDTDHPSALLLFDLDGFKEINDTLGHRAGDELLVLVADRLSTATRATDTVTRLGGDEFAVLLTDLDSAPDSPNGAADAEKTAQRLRQILREPAAIGLITVETEASVGIAVSPDHGGDIDTLLRCADVAMYHAKNNGLGVTTYDPSADTRDEHQLTVLTELRHAITAGELRLHYQPKCRPDGAVDRVEALVRWQHPGRGLLGPVAFLQLAEHTSLIKPLTAWVIDEATRQCASWHAAGRPLNVAINISPRNLVDPELPDTVLGAIAAAAIPTGMIELEITETAITTDPQRAYATLQRLHSLGIGVAIDDFGVGYTSLSQLGTLPVDTLKIDRLFVADLLTNAAHETVVRNIIRLSRELGLRTVAEGVESHDIWTRLNEFGCDEIQGYVLTPPLPPDQLVSWLDNQSAATGLDRRSDDRRAHDQATLTT